MASLMMYTYCDISSLYVTKAFWKFSIFSAVLRIELCLEQVLLSYILVASCIFSLEMGSYEVVQMDLEFAL